MREIKFRAWDNKLKKYIDMFLNFSIRDGVLEYLDDIMNIKKRVVIEQYTGLKDKNGVEIYEGDVLWTGVDYVYISFKSGAFVVISGIEDEMALSGYPIDEWTISGNIHENADLLEEQS